MVPHMPVSQLSWKKCLSVTSQEKKCLFLNGEEKIILFSCWKEKNNMVRKKNHTHPPGIKWSGPYVCHFLLCLQYRDCQNFSCFLNGLQYAYVVFFYVTVQ